MRQNCHPQIDGLVPLSLDQLESVGEALLSFRDLSDLRQWLVQH
ncbi:MAG: DUF4351 domain-containing protein [Synechococcaceae cyanobacterium SM2_3_1]|nr:DUF4351 domain-containing protein [Synechococcaceae cyanobacterium SM2_3_1]